MLNLNDKFFSFPPYLSTGWENIAAISLASSGQILIHLPSGESITLPKLTEEETQSIFTAHASFLERQVLKEPLYKKERPPTPAQSAEMPIRIGFGSNFEGLPSTLQHNPAQSDGPDLPQEMLAKIAQISKILVPEELQELPPAEPHCNCHHCQIVRAIQGEVRNKISAALPAIITEEEISEEDLKFQQWDITQIGDKLFTVVNKLDHLEKYSVYLGHPVGCTCGKEGCEHILVVLNS